MTRYFSPGKSKTSSNWMMLGWSIAVKMEISLSIMCSFPWHFACIKQNGSNKKLRWESEEIFWVNSSFQLSKKPATHLKQLIRQKWAINSSPETTLQMSKSIKSGHWLHNHLTAAETMTMVSFHLVNNLDCKLLPGDATVADTHHCKIAVANHLGSWSQSDETFATSNREKSNMIFKYCSPGADGTFQWPPPARSRQCPRWRESCFHSSVLRSRSGETCCKEKVDKRWCVIDSAFSGMSLILYSDCAKVILTFLGKKQLVGLIYPSKRCKNMIHDGRGSALRKPRLNWSAGVELFLGEGIKTLSNLIFMNFHQML